MPLRLHLIALLFIGLAAATEAQEPADTEFALEHSQILTHERDVVPTTKARNREELITLDNIGELSLTREAPEPWTYYPLAVGNAWEYTIANGGYFRIDISNDSLINGSIYFLYNVSTFDAGGVPIDTRDYYVRYDTTSAIIFQYGKYNQMDSLFDYIPCEFDPDDLKDVLCHEFNGTAEFHSVTYSIGDTTWIEANAYTVHPYFGGITYISSLGEIYGSNKWIGYYELTYAQVNNLEYGTEQFPVNSEPYYPARLNFDIWPNPTSSHINIQLYDKSGMSYEYLLFNISGQMVRNGSIDYQYHTFDLSHLASGPYIFVLKQASTILLSTIIIKSR